AVRKDDLARPGIPRVAAGHTEAGAHARTLAAIRVLRWQQHIEVDQRAGPATEPTWAAAVHAQLVTVHPERIIDLEGLDVGQRDPAQSRHVAHRLEAITACDSAGARHAEPLVGHIEAPVGADPRCVAVGRAAPTGAGLFGHR